MSVDQENIDAQTASSTVQTNNIVCDSFRESDIDVESVARQARNILRAEHGPLSAAQLAERLSVVCVEKHSLISVG